MFHGSISACALADQLRARFNDRQHRTSIERHADSAVVQIGSPNGTPLTLHIADLSGGVLVTMSRGRDWLDQAGDTAQMIERAAQNPLSLLSMLPDVLGEMRKDNLPQQVWNAINDLMSLSRALAGEKNAPANPKLCPHCNTANDPELEQCSACGAPLPVQLPRACPKCGRQHTSDALFCQACGTRLVEG
jgi:hypothetical protein